MVQKITRVSKL